MEEQFNSIYEKWLHDTRFLSGGFDKSPYYKQLVEMGPEIIPFLLREIPKERGFPDLVLRGIVGKDGPVIPEEQRGRMKYIFNAWLDWGKEKGYTSNDTI